MEMVPSEDIIQTVDVVETELVVESEATEASIGYLSPSAVQAQKTKSLSSSSTAQG